MKNLHYFFATGYKVSDVDPSSRTLILTISDQTLDRYDEIMIAKGCDLEDFEKNPVHLWYHNLVEALPPIGIHQWTKIVKTEIRAKVEFYPNDFAMGLFNMHRLGFLKGVSVGFRTHKDVWNEDYQRGQGKKNRVPRRIVEEWELLESSSVPIPANPNALQKALDSGELRLPESLIKALRIPEQREGVDPLFEYKSFVIAPALAWLEKKGAMEGGNLEAIPVDKISRSVSGKEFEEIMRSYGLEIPEKSDSESKNAEDEEIPEANSPSEEGGDPESPETDENPEEDGAEMPEVMRSQEETGEDTSSEENSKEQAERDDEEGKETPPEEEEDDESVLELVDEDLEFGELLSEEEVKQILEGKPYPNEHSARLKDPNGFDPKSFRRKKDGTIYGKIKVPSSAAVIWGKTKEHNKPSDNPIPQAIRFPTSDWSVADAKKWLKDNNVKFILFEPAKKSAEEIEIDETTFASSREDAENSAEKIEISEDDLKFVVSGLVDSVRGEFNRRLGKIDSEKGGNDK